MNTELELRLNTDDAIEFRAGEGDHPNVLIGYAAVYNSLSAELPGNFKERILPGAFNDSITGGGDIRALVDHDSTKLLGRTSNGTLKLTPDDHGLRVEIALPDTSYAKDIRALVARKDVKGMSFGFRVPKDGQRFIKQDGLSIRELSKIDLREVTVTSIPAYGDTSISVRVDPSVSEQIKEAEPKENSESEIVRCSRQLRYLMAND